MSAPRKVSMKPKSAIDVSLSEKRIAATGKPTKRRTAADPPAGNNQSMEAILELPQSLKDCTKLRPASNRNLADPPTSVASGFEAGVETVLNTPLSSPSGLVVKAPTSSSKKEQGKPRLEGTKTVLNTPPSQANRMAVKAQIGSYRPPRSPASKAPTSSSPYTKQSPKRPRDSGEGVETVLQRTESGRYTKIDLKVRSDADSLPSTPRQHSPGSIPMSAPFRDDDDVSETTPRKRQKQDAEKDEIEKDEIISEIFQVSGTSKAPKSCLPSLTLSKFRSNDSKSKEHETAEESQQQADEKNVNVGTQKSKPNKSIISQFMSPKLPRFRSHDKRKADEHEGEIIANDETESDNFAELNEKPPAEEISAAISNAFHVKTQQSGSQKKSCLSVPSIFNGTKPAKADLDQEEAAPPTNIVPALPTKSSATKEAPMPGFSEHDSPQGEVSETIVYASQSAKMRDKTRKRAKNAKLSGQRTEATTPGTIATAPTFMAPTKSKETTKNKASSSNSKYSNMKQHISKSEGSSSNSKDPKQHISKSKGSISNSKDSKQHVSKNKNSASSSKDSKRRISSSNSKESKSSAGVPTSIEAHSRDTLTDYSVNSSSVNTIPPPGLRVRVGIGVLVKDPLKPGNIFCGIRKGSHGAGTLALPGGHL